MGTLRSIDYLKELYVINEASGITCLGFHVCHRWASTLSQELENKPLPDNCKPGSPALWVEWCRLSQAGVEKAKTGWRSAACLTPELTGKEGKRVEVRHQYENGPVEISKFWVGKSTGWMPCHLEIKTRQERSGMGVMLGKILSVRVIQN